MKRKQHICHLCKLSGQRTVFKSPFRLATHTENFHTSEETAYNIRRSARANRKMRRGKATRAVELSY